MAAQVQICSRVPLALLLPVASRHLPDPVLTRVPLLKVHFWAAVALQSYSWILVPLAVAAAVILLWCSGGSSKAESVTVREGSTLTSLCPELDRRGLIPGNCTTYRLFARLLGSSDGIQAGEFEIPAGTSGAKLLDILQHGQPVQRLGHHVGLEVEQRLGPGRLAEAGEHDEAVPAHAYPIPSAT